MTDQNSPAGSTPPGFYPDGSGNQRYWDGTQWTDQFQPAAAPVAAAPATKSHTVRNIFIGVLIAFGLMFAGCVALLGGAANEIDNAIEAEEEKDAQPGGPDNPLPITEGEAFSVLGFDYAAGWSVDEDVFGGPEINGLKVTNNRDETDGVFAEIKFMRGTEVLAVVNCTTEQVSVGETTTLDCGSTDELPSEYDEITISDTF